MDYKRVNKRTFKYRGNELKKDLRSFLLCKVIKEALIKDSILSLSCVTKTFVVE